MDLTKYEDRVHRVRDLRVHVHRVRVHHGHLLYAHLHVHHDHLLYVHLHAHVHRDLLLFLHGHHGHLLCDRAHHVHQRYFFL